MATAKDLIRMAAGMTPDAPPLKAPKFRAAAIRYKGKVYEGFSHPEIFEQNPDIDLDAAEMGFATQTGQYVSRDDASWMVGSPEPLEAATAVERGLQGPASKKLRIAIKTGSGRVVLGQAGDIHAMVAKRAGVSSFGEFGGYGRKPELGPIEDTEWVGGFVDPEGKFLDRDQAEAYVAETFPDYVEQTKNDKYHAAGESVTMRQKGVSNIRAGDVLTPRRTVAQNAGSDLKSIGQALVRDPSLLAQSMLGPIGSTIMDFFRTKIEGQGESMQRTAARTAMPVDLVESSPGWAKAMAGAVRTGTDLAKMAMGMGPGDMRANLQKTASGVAEGFGQNPVISALGMAAPFLDIAGNRAMQSSLNLNPEKVGVKTEYNVGDRTRVLDTTVHSGETMQRTVFRTRDESGALVGAGPLWHLGYPGGNQMTGSEYGDLIETAPRDLSSIPVDLASHSTFPNAIPPALFGGSLEAAINLYPALRHVVSKYPHIGFPSLFYGEGPRRAMTGGFLPSTDRIRIGGIEPDAVEAMGSLAHPETVLHELIHRNDSIARTLDPRAATPQQAALLEARAVGAGSLLGLPLSHTIGEADKFMLSSGRLAQRFKPISTESHDLSRSFMEDVFRDAGPFGRNIKPVKSTTDMWMMYFPEFGR